MVETGLAAAGAGLEMAVLAGAGAAAGLTAGAAAGFGLASAAAGAPPLASPEHNGMPSLAARASYSLPSKLASKNFLNH